MLKNIDFPKNDVQYYNTGYEQGSFALSPDNTCVISGTYRKINTYKDVRYIYIIDPEYTLHVLPNPIISQTTVIRQAFFYNNLLYLFAESWDHLNNTIINDYQYLIVHDARYPYNQRELIKLEEEWRYPVHLSSDNYIWTINASRISSSEALLRFDGTNIETFPAIKIINNYTKIFPIDSDNMIAGNACGDISIMDKGIWSSYDICGRKKNEFSITGIWASSPDDIYVIGDGGDEYVSNFHYYWDGFCWTRFEKNSAYNHIADIQGNADGSIVFAIFETSNLNSIIVRLHKY